jgi:hypothetical protein
MKRIGNVLHQAQHGRTNCLNELHISVKAHIWATARANGLSMPEWMRKRKQEKHASASAT